jgi:hypothetical protein
MPNNRQHGVLARFLMYYPNKSTKRLYRQSLEKYFQYYYGQNCNTHTVADEYIYSDKDFELDVRAHF